MATHSWRNWEYHNTNNSTAEPPRPIGHKERWDWRYGTFALNAGVEGVRQEGDCEEADLWHDNIRHDKDPEKNVSSSNEEGDDQQKDLVQEYHKDICDVDKEKVKYLGEQELENNGSERDNAYTCGQY